MDVIRDSLFSMMSCEESPPKERKDKFQSGCAFKTKSGRTMTDHKNTHKSHPCPECSKTFKSLRHFKVHMAVHRGEPGPNIRCEWYGCERVFRESTSMKDHMNSHTLEISHTCLWPNCGKTYVLKSSLSNHMQRHEGKGRYNCPHCDYGSTNPIRYKNHLKRHENQTNDS